MAIFIELQYREGLGSEPVAILPFLPVPCRILITGSIAYDFLLHYEGYFVQGLQESNLEQLSVAFIAEHFERHHGGTGANIAWNARLLQQDPLLVGTVGHDGGAYCALLDERGIDTTYIEQLADHVTSMAIVATDCNERQITFFHPGADSYGSWPDLSSKREEIGYAIMSPRDIRVNLQALELCHVLGVPTLFDPGQGVLAMERDEMWRALKLCTGCIVNDYEWGLAANLLRISLDDVLREVEYVIVTHGGEGFTIFTQKGEEVFPSCRTEKVVNPIGAGDAFRAGFLTGMMGGWSLADGGKLGAALASKVVEQEGALLSELGLNDIVNRAGMAYEHELPPIPCLYRSMLGH